MKSLQVELFTAGCPVCEPVIEMVYNMSNQNCEVKVYNLSLQNNEEANTKLKDYAIAILPAVAINGKLLSCCVNVGINEKALKQAGLGK